MTRLKLRTVIGFLLYLALMLGIILISEAQESPYKALLEGITEEKYEDADFVTVFDSTVVDVEESGLSHIDIHTLAKALKPAGAIDLSTRRFDYDPASNMIELKKVAIHRADGSVEPIDLNTAIDEFATAYMIYWGGRMKVINVPGLQPGDAVEIAYYKKGFMIAYLDQEDDSRYIPPMRGHYYDSIIFGAGHPIREKVYLLRTLRNVPVQFEVYNGNVMCKSTFDDGYNHYVFKKSDIPVYKYEYRSPYGSDYIPKVVLATVKDWYDKSLWFHHANEDSVLEVYGVKAKPFDIPPDVKAKAEEIAAPYETDVDRRKAILHWCAQHIRYSGISMGKGEGYTLHPSHMNFRDRCGVCKDIAAMSLQMFRALGYKAFPTMTMAGARVERIPADQFNHCVVAVDISDEGIESDALPGTKWEMYDATWAPNSMDIWSRYEGDQHIVIGGPQGEDLKAIRVFTPEENRLTITSVAEIDKDGNLTGTLVFNAIGAPDSRLRRLFAYQHGVEYLRNSISRYIENIAPNAELVSYKGGNLSDYWHPFPVTVSYRVPGYALLYGKGLHFSSPAGRFQTKAYFVRPITRYATMEERNNPLFIYAPEQVVIKETVKLPRGYKKLEEFDAIEAGGDFSDFDASVEMSKRGVKVSYKYTVSERNVEPGDEYSQVRAVVKAINEFAGKEIHIWRK